ncbi:MAG: hypothetical protein IKI32_01680 [Lachnospiraceae bacterium]|nr:hypothetical protein [Parasporobacterium sp.]MBR3516501.1 hypothetical protein [Lachnospiraceae bacterium]MBR7075611.1 hypothetical protein [Lachnospiraceae bacterium]
MKAIIEREIGEGEKIIDHFLEDTKDLTTEELTKLSLAMSAEIKVLEDKRRLFESLVDYRRRTDDIESVIKHRNIHSGNA